MQLFDQARIGTMTLPNRIIRSATFEGRCDDTGIPTEAYSRLYETLARHQIGAIIAGFAFISSDGRAIQPGQAGIDSDDTIRAFSEVARRVHTAGGRIVLQIAHTGRQTFPAATGGPVYSPGVASSPYFRSRPQRLTLDGISAIVEAFGHAARRAKAAGFDGVQIHAAHGYLIHQFINPAVNDRIDTFGIDTEIGIGTEFLRQVITKIRDRCGADYPLLIKISAGDEYRRGINRDRFRNLVRFIDSQPIDAIEISWGTMDHALNIFRGTDVPADLVLDHNPRYRTNNPLARIAFKLMALPFLRVTIKPFAPAYNLPFAIIAREQTKIPIICVGGFRCGEEINRVIAENRIDFVSLSRPFIREPALVMRWQKDLNYRSSCTSCNRCAIMCDSGQPTHCYQVSL
jgi:2,4-dienoyl-CoA reductase-like NADH-dependent reductase (Old Yellow Enzyme family)